MASSKHIPCGPCQDGKVNNKADNWCYNCEKGLCSICSGLHKRSKLSRDHKTIGLIGDKPSIHAIKTVCDKHSQQLNVFCPSHLMPCCDECVFTSHSKCTGILSLASVVEKTKLEKSKESLDRDINSTLKILNTIVINKLENTRRGDQQYECIKETVAKFRKKINNHLDYLEEKLYQNADTILNQEKSKASMLITEIEEKKGKLNEMKDQLHAVTSHSSQLESFLGVHQIEQQVHECERFVEDLEDDDRAKEFDIKINQRDEIKKPLSKLGSFESLEVILVKTKIALNREASVRREAQVQSLVQSDTNSMAMHIETKIEINMKKLIRDMICLMDGRVIVIEDNGKVNLLTSEGKLEKQLRISEKAHSVTQINEDTIAITYPHEKAIKIFNMENETVTEVISLYVRCYGLSFSNKSLAVGLSNDEIRFIELEGTTRKSIQVQSESLLKYLVFFDNRVIYSDYKYKAVYCVDVSGEQIWQYEQELSFPKGLCTDANGNILVADQTSNRIIVISKDGQYSQVLISEEDELKSPQCICFKNDESSGFICDSYCNYLAKFNLSTR